MTKNKKHTNKIDRSRKDKPKNKIDIDINASGSLSIKVSRNPDVLDKIREVIKWLPLQECITDNDVKSKTEEIYNILIQDEESNEWQATTTKQIRGYLSKMDKVLDSLKEAVAGLPHDVINYLTDNTEPIIIGESEVYTPEQVYNDFFNIININKARILVSRAMQKLQEAQNLKTERGKKTDLYLEFITKKLALIFLELTGKMPTRETRDDHKGTNKLSVYGQFMEKIFKIGNIKASAMHYVKISIEYLQNFYGVNSQKTRQ